MKKIPVRKKADWFPVLLISPTVLLLLGLSIYPTIKSFSYSFMNYQRRDLSSQGFIGLENFIEIFTDDKLFFSSLWNSFKWVGSEVVLQLILGLIFALILNKKFRGRGVARTICFAPWAISGVLTTMLWILIYNENIGLLNNVLGMMGLEQYEMSWLANKSTVFKSIVLSELWRGIPFFAINMLAALQGIPGDIYESAKVDGAGSWKIFWKITLPYLKETIIFATLMRCIWEFQSIDMILTMTNGGPNRQTTTLPIYMYQKAMIEGDYGYGSALAVCSFLILSVFAIVYLKLNHFGKGIEE